MVQKPKSQYMQLKKFLINLSVFVILYLILAYPLQYIVDTGLKKSDFSTEYKEWDDITKSRINADIIIQGSSKAWKQISPKKFEQAFKLSTYNLGMDGQHFPMQKWRSDVYLKYNKRPKYIIQIVALTELQNPVIQYNYTQYIPYLNEGFIERFGGNSYLDWRDFYIPLYKYCHNTGMIEAGLRNFFNTHDNRQGKYKGFRSQNTNWTESDLNDFKKKNPHGMTVEIDPVAYSDFENMIKSCAKARIDLILVCPPTPVSFQNEIVNHAAIMNIYQNFSAKYGLKYLDYSKDTLCLDKAMFYNFNHLNTKGVEIFNEQLINDLKGEIK